MQNNKKKEDKDKKPIEKFSNTIMTPWFIVGLILIAIIVFAVWYNRELFYKPINHRPVQVYNPPVQVYNPPVQVYNPPYQYRGLVPPINNQLKPQVPYAQLKPQVPYTQPVYNNQYKPQAPPASAPPYYINQPQAPPASAPPASPTYYNNQPPSPSAPPASPIALAQLGKGLGKGLEHLTDTPSTISAKYLNEGNNWDEFRKSFKIPNELSELEFVDILRNSLQRK
jgi:hypothetical protein